MAADQNEESTKKLKCSLCCKQFKYESERKRHEQSHSLQFQCSFCLKKFNFISALRRHEKQHNRKGSVQCKECSRKFRDDVLLKRHIDYAHKGTFICEECSTPFNSKTALQTHLKTHRPESERRYKCSHKGCHKTFNFPHHLKHHELTHTNEKLHFCSVCGKGFIQSHHLKAHLKTHDPETWYKCEILNCKKKFISEYALKRHQELHMKKLSAISSDAEYKISSSPPEWEDSKPSSKALFESTCLDTTACPNCGVVIFEAYYNEHTVICKGNNNIENKTFVEIYSHREAINDSHDDNINVIENIRNCKTVLGGCLIESEGGKCLCEQMSNSNEEVDNVEDLKPILNSNDVIKVEGDVKKVPQSKCDECECAKTCVIKDTGLKKSCMQNTKSRSSNENRTVEVINGAIKVVDSCDLLIPNADSDASKFEIPNSCKDMLGECIVTDEGCLCAQMKFDQIIAEEIASITPQPKINM